MADLLLNTYKQKITGLELIPSDGGCFEVTAGGDLVYSKLETGEFPSEEVVVESVGGKLS